MIPPASASNKALEAQKTDFFFASSFKSFRIPGRSEIASQREISGKHNLPKTWSSNLPKSVWLLIVLTVSNCEKSLEPSFVRTCKHIFCILSLSSTSYLSLESIKGIHCQAIDGRSCIQEICNFFEIPNISILILRSIGKSVRNLSCILRQPSRFLPSNCDGVKSDLKIWKVNSNFGIQRSFHFKSMSLFCCNMCKI